MDNSPDSDLIDAIKAGFGLQTDAEVAAFLGITRGAIYRVRRGKTRLGPLQRLKLLDRLAFLRLRSLVESISPDSLAAAIRSASKRQAGKIADAKLRRTRAKNPDAELIDEFKEAFGFQNDAELADFLGLSCQTISTVRTGRSSLGTRPRLRMLNRIEPFELERVEDAIVDTNTMIDLIQQYRAKDQAS